MDLVFLGDSSPAGQLGRITAIAGVRNAPRKRSLGTPIAKEWETSP